MWKICVCGDYRELAVYKKNFDFVEEHIQRLFVPEDVEQKYLANIEGLEESDVTIPAANCFLPGSLKSTGPEISVENITQYARIAFTRAKNIGCNLFVFGSGGSRQIPDNFSRSSAEEQFAQVLKAVGKVAAEVGITIVVEPLNTGECNFINSVAEGAELVKVCDMTNVRLLADFYHMMREDEDPDEIYTFGHLLHHVHLAEKTYRTAPGIEGDDFRPYLKALAKSRYEGLLSIECKWREDMEAEIILGVDTIRRQIQDCI